MEDIPVEIGAYIASLIVLQRDVASLCLVSSQWLDVARPILYKHLRLRYHSPNGRHTIDMLNSTEDIKRYVEVLTLTGPMKPPILREAWIMEADLQGMVNLHTLRIFDFYLIPVSIVQKTIGNVYSAVPSLENIISYGGYDKDRYKRAKVLPIAPAKLKSVRVGCHLIFDELLITTFLLHPSSITSLELNHINGKIINLLSALKLPMLNKFSTIISSDTGIDEQTNGLATFLASHPTIQTCGIFSDYGLKINANTPINIMPKLTVLSGTPDIISGLAKICDAFKFITSLSINTSGYYTGGFPRLAQDIGGFPRLRYFKIGLPEQLTLQLIKSLASYMTEIEHFSLPLVQLQHNSGLANQIIESFSLFRRLKRLYVGHSGISLSQMTLLAQKNISLREIHFLGLDGREDRILVREGEPKHSTLFRVVFHGTTDRIWWQDNDLK